MGVRVDRIHKVGYIWKSFGESSEQEKTAFMQGFLKSLNELVASVHENKAYDTAERLDEALWRAPIADTVHDAHPSRRALTSAQYGYRVLTSAVGPPDDGAEDPESWLVTVSKATD
jgi:hypothetical protein